MKSSALSIALPLLLGACSSMPGGGKDIATGDFDGDGRSDKATLVTLSDRLLLTVQRDSAEPQTLEFGVGSGAQDAVCALPVSLTVSPASCEADGSMLPGCVAAPGRMDLSISDGACDAIHLYWDQTSQRMAWWRL
jgi:hypothetical protein